MMALLCLLAGGAIGVLSGLSLRWTAVRFSADAPLSAVALMVGGAFLRWGLAAVLLAIGLRSGIAPGLAAFAGLWLARWAVVWWLSRIPMEPGG